MREGQWQVSCSLLLVHANSLFYYFLLIKKMTRYLMSSSQRSRGVCLFNTEVKRHKYPWDFGDMISVMVPSEDRLRAEPGRVALFSLEWSFFLRTSSWHHRHLIPEQLQESSCVGVDDGHCCCVRSSPDLLRSNVEDSCAAELNLVLI